MLKTGSNLEKENLRREALLSCGIMDSLPEGNYDALTTLAASICEAPIAYISFISDNRLWLKSALGLPADLKNVPREETLCNYTISEEEEVLEIYDTLNDRRFSGLPSVTGPPFVRSYVGAALIDENGFRLGSLCVIDMVPRKFSPHQITCLKMLSKQVISLISLRKQQKLQDEYAQLFDSSNEIHCILNRDARIHKINNSVESMLGFAPQEAIGRYIWDYCIDCDLPVLRNKIANEISLKHKYFEVETRISDKSGNIIWMSWSANFTHEKWYVSGRNITGQKQILDELKELSVVADGVNNGIIITDKNGIVVWTNRALEKMMGYSLADFNGKKPGDVIRGEHTDMTTVMKARELAENNQPYEVDIQAYRKDGSIIWLTVINSVLFDDEGGLLKQIKVFVDITARKNAEEEMIKAREEALQLSRAKDLFISVMSHEIRTPLNAVIGVSHLLMDEDLNPQQKENVQVLQFSAQNLMGLINDVLDLTKIETGNLELEQADVDLADLIKGIIRTQEYKTIEKNIYLKARLDSEIPKLVLADKTRLYQILMNLIGNAIKFTNEGGITVAIKNTGENEHNVSLLFEVRDTGIGIAKDKQGGIFEVFVQAESDTTRNYGGTGLGLPITKKLIELYGSTIQLESSPGKGSVFSFEINFVKSTNQKIAHHSKIKQPLNMSVLIVDDNQINRLLVGKVLTKWGVKTDFAEDGLIAVDKISSENQYDAVLMDINMPNMNGLEATKVIRQKHETYFKDLPILALTASIMQSELDDMSNAGMNDYVLKPFDPDILYEKLSVC